ncbi:nucleotidase [Citrobacter koseri]|uniref:Nucleotidase n=1 Tax=Citrobacter koseri TaxID=545 RepID=A0A2X2VBD8_CITKO|nr:nucleotidase [Citrobacter koseri]
MDYQNGAITSLQLQRQRFVGWGEQLNVPPEELNDAFMNAMAEICAPLPGAVSLVNALHGKVKMGIITNGFTSLQQIRLERTGLRDRFDLLVISEEVGVAKPDPRIFDYALEQAGSPDRSRVLMVGDTAESDILGGINAGLSTCWLNAHHREQPAGIEPTWTVASLSELEQLLCKH